MAVARTKLTVGDVLTPPDYITSPSDGFAFGFRAHDSDPSKFILATWFRFGGGNSSRPPQPESMVWFAKESSMGATPNATARSVLSITTDGQLTLADGSNQVLWTASTSSTRREYVLTLSDSGNARFLGGDGHTVLWESFWHPTDTLLPGQTLQGMLLSKRAGAEFTTRRYSLAGQDDGNVVLSNYVLFARMDTDGIVRTYFRPRNGIETTSWTTKERLSCLCPPGYTYIDTRHTDSGCTPAFEPQSCEEISIYYKKFPSVTCREYCLNDCFCTAALMMNRSDCEEVGALAYGRQGEDVTTNALVKVRKGNSTSHMEGVPSAKTTTTTKLRPYKIITVCLSSLFVITVSIIVAQHYLSRKYTDSQRPLCSSVRAFSLKELYQVTNGFEKLLPHLIAVKKLIDSNEYCEQEFANEVQSIGQIHHRNLVRMVGYCKEGKHRMMVFEFMPGGSLRSFLFNPEKRPPWRWRAEAAVAIARGLEYLHDGCSVPIIHCDIKPDNILLDDHGVPRITDFGISKLLGSQQVYTTVTHVRGTRGTSRPSGSAATRAWTPRPTCTASASCCWR
ncbi:hypothetical protein HU200_037293 [Digitaria exilis]|uniref:non-specific serine/threonine protein kinase n=1 Tax=Digitaria exilis TaxID=1010633 RepID=A0A835ENC4_9POAL|nr:hypothetical protein HU200_037293 [Digitaria exilis]